MPAAERWKRLPLLGLNHYAISDQGRVHNMRKKTSVVTTAQAGHLHVYLYDNLGGHNFRVARLVWLTFRGEAWRRKGFGYKDGNFRNCAPENLIPNVGKG